MKRSELLGYFQNEEYDDYVKHFLIKHWQDESTHGNWSELVTNGFAAKHTVRGTISQNAAVDVCQQRSAFGANAFTSTLLSENLVKNAITYIAKNVIENHGKVQRAFTNYALGVKGTMWTVTSHPGKGFLPTCYSDKVVVGIDKSGLIAHFHGDATYAKGKIVNT